MAGANPQKNNHHPSSSSSSHHHKSQPQSTTTTNNKPSPSNPHSNPNKPKPKPSPKLNPNPRPETFPPPHPHPPPPPAYGFHMLDRRTIVLADGTARSYFALPPDYQDLPPVIPRGPIRPPGPDPWLGFDNRDHYRQQNQEYWNNLEGGNRKRKFGEEVNDEFARQRQQLLQYGAGPSSREEGRAGKVMRPGGVNEVDEGKVKSAFLNFVRVLNENGNQKKKYLADGKQGALQCLACGRCIR
ncbi:hypothetical protein M8C21_021594 [Ambrosia artemisiifolia]|uniref:Uncharacterized protein n=1 Tax=Ambrosia artemisiifolia TaxID=4212 RepID=A0AAD5GMC3_AMBAR|nr:hypothetical protein M8C21_021594 [Ambrosia artemisiifolia]